eukprot:CAMPEP_0182912610 /NCGR_PEP_ID=MMETSP0034_2-20130328/37601_1 /TAXON_ID=156128 /ORGANISM="Nephroselmis pyriformis, Strain CCMP717" /LENGTH=423 /DNA_ID=CAMNT_0025049287 /DNA_START=42 /DNA_END=1313 /DNA_ORIENTATION=+
MSASICASAARVAALPGATLSSSTSDFAGAPAALTATCRASVQCKASARSTRLIACSAESESTSSRRDVLKGSIAAGVAATALGAPKEAQAGLFGDAPQSPWVQVPLNLDDGIVLMDIAFTGDDPNHGFLLGTRQTLLETFDGGATWEKRSIQAAADSDINYRLNGISFNGSEGWIVGKPAIVLHTTNGGKDWERIPLSAKLPGTPVKITALPADGAAEMTTDQGAIYVTANAAYTWRAAVDETVDATLNRTVSSGISGASYYTGTFATVARNDDGQYIAVSSRGNFYMTWEPGQSFWFPHNRSTARRVQNMGFRPDGGLWMSVRGGGVFQAPAKEGINSETFDEAKLGSRGFGILDIGYRTADEAWACGGSGSLYKSTDAGESWKRDRSTDDIAANLYLIKFPAKDKGFVLGNDGVLLRYVA